MIANLATVLPAPAKYSPIRHPERAIKKRDLVLRVMLNNGYISESIHSAYTNIELPIKNIDFDNSLASYFSEYIRRELETLDEELNINIYEDGLQINTTLDMGIQSIVETAFNEVMKKNQKIFSNEILSSKNKLNELSDYYGVSIDSIKTFLNDTTVIPQKYRSNL